MATLTRNEVRLAYEEIGQGEPAMVFVHGWSCNRAFFGPQMEHFSRQRRCVGVDLRGHGDSDKPRQDYTMEGFADDLAWLCQQLQIERPVVVGHSSSAAWWRWCWRPGRGRSCPGDRDGGWRNPRAN